ncbi:MAG: ATP-binding protein [Deltaproteobacteria bacterium]|nr:ATP-binding protein [Deltaproteobacteria bacterium]
MDRAQHDRILKDLEKKMVFLTGPRQVGKTWLAKNIAGRFPKAVYLNYDRLEDRGIIEGERWLDTTDLLVLDELHKMPDWKNRLKGIYDTRPASLRILVTGSARLETSRQLGDSLAGRFFRHRLLPLSLAELPPADRDLERLMRRGGFPEPYLAGNEVDAERWRMQYIDGLIRTDVFDIERVHDLRAMQLVLELLRLRVGSPVSYSSIARDVAVSPNTVRKFVGILEALYVVFRVTPHSRDIARSLLSQPKIYFFDTGMVAGDEGARFENLVAVSLLKHVFARADYQGERVDLCYLRTKDGEEVDFCLVRDGAAELMLETKVSGPDAGATLARFHERTGTPAAAVFQHLRREQHAGAVTLHGAENFLAGLMM